MSHESSHAGLTRRSTVAGLLSSIPGVRSLARKSAHASSDGTTCESDSAYLQRFSNAQQQFIRVGDWDIHIVSMGSGPTVLLLHGLGSSWRWWEPVIDRIAADYQVVAIDLPGAGQSSDLTEPPTARQYADLVEAVLSLYGPATVIGHSLGGFVAVQSAIHKVANLSSLVLSAPAGFGPIENQYFRWIALPGLGSALKRTGDMGINMLMSSLVHDKSSLETMECWLNDSASSRDQVVYQLQLALDWTGNTRSELLIDDDLNFSIPTLLLWGKHDTVFPLSTGQDAAKRLGIEGPLVAENSGHFVHVEETDWFVDHVLRFLPGIS